MLCVRTLRGVENILQKGVDADGGYLVPDEYDDRLIEMLEEENIIHTCLYLLDMSVALKVETFKKDSVLKIKENWESIRKAIKDTVDLLNEFGFNS